LEGLHGEEKPSGNTDMMEDGEEHQATNKKAIDGDITDEDYQDSNYHVSKIRSKYFYY
jgi:hypothetical protein